MNRKMVYQRKEDWKATARLRRAMKVLWVWLWVKKKRGDSGGGPMSLNRWRVIRNIKGKNWFLDPKSLFIHLILSACHPYTIYFPL